MWSLPVRGNPESGQHCEACDHKRVSKSCQKLCLVFVSSHPVPVETKAKAVQLLPHGLDITEGRSHSRAALQDMSAH